MLRKMVASNWGWLCGEVCSEGKGFFFRVWSFGGKPKSLERMLPTVNRSRPSAGYRSNSVLPQYLRRIIKVLMCFVFARNWYDSYGALEQKKKKNKKKMIMMMKEEDEENEERQSWRRRRRRQWRSDSCGGRHHQSLVELIRVALWFVVSTNGFGVYFLANASSVHIAKSRVSFIPPKILQLAENPTLEWNFYAVFFLGFATNIICVINGNKKCSFPMQQTSSMYVYTYFLILVYKLMTIPMFLAVLLFLEMQLPAHQVPQA